MTGVSMSGAGTPTDDFSVCDFSAVSTKHDLASVDNLTFLLSAGPDRRIPSFNRSVIELTVTPSVKRRETIFDGDTLIYCICQLMSALNADAHVSRHLNLTAQDLLLAAHRESSGDAFHRLREAFERRAGTRIATNIPTGPKDDPAEFASGFGLIEAWENLRETNKGCMVSVIVTPSKRLDRPVLAKAALTLSHDSFTLRRPLEPNQRTEISAQRGDAGFLAWLRGRIG